LCTDNGKPAEWNCKKTIILPVRVNTEQDGFKDQK
jgi:hypothetical protein